MEEWKKEHGRVIDSFLEEMNKFSDRYVLKGGTALMKCYGLNRFSEDIDLDGTGTEIISIVDRFCREHNYEYRIAKNTDTVKRCMIHYNAENKPLKVEVSSRRKHIPESEVAYINGIRVYNIDTLAMMKCNAYAGRDKIRDLFDVTFICNHYYEQLSESTRFNMQNVVANKGIEQFDYIISTQQDELIDPDQLAEEFLEMYERLGLIMEDEEVEEIKNAGEELDKGISTQQESVEQAVTKRQKQADVPRIRLL